MEKSAKVEVIQSQQLRCALIGIPASGKSSLAARFALQQLNSQQTKTNSSSQASLRTTDDAASRESSQILASMVRKKLENTLITPTPTKGFDLFYSHLTIGDKDYNLQISDFGAHIDNHASLENSVKKGCVVFWVIDASKEFATQKEFFNHLLKTPITLPSVLAVVICKRDLVQEPKINALKQQIKNFFEGKNYSTNCYIEEPFVIAKDDEDKEIFTNVFKAGCSQLVKNLEKSFENSLKPLGLKNFKKVKKEWNKLSDKRWSRFPIAVQLLERAVKPTFLERFFWFWVKTKPYKVEIRNLCQKYYDAEILSFSNFSQELETIIKKYPKLADQYLHLLAVKIKHEASYARNCEPLRMKNDLKDLFTSHRLKSLSALGFGGEVVKLSKTENIKIPKGIYLVKEAYHQQGTTEQEAIKASLKILRTRAIHTSFWRATTTQVIYQDFANREMDDNALNVATKVS